MTAFVVFIREGEIVDPEAMAAYKSAGAASPPDPNLKVRVLYGAMETLEGGAADGVVILEFPTMQAARDWYYGDYHERAKLRQKAAPHRGFIVEGL